MLGVGAPRGEQLTALGGTNCGQRDANTVAAKREVRIRARSTAMICVVVWRSRSQGRNAVDACMVVVYRHIGLPAGMYANSEMFQIVLTIMIVN